MKRLHLSFMALATVLVPTMIFAGTVNKFATAKAVQAENNMVVVPLEVTNEDNLVAIDIPVRYSEGVVLKDVTFENTRVEYFDLKVFNHDANGRTVVIGLLPQMTTEHKPGLSAGTGLVANLVFEVVDENAKEVTIETVDLTEPDHSLVFVYNDRDASGQLTQREEKPSFERTTVQFAGGSSSSVPKTYALKPASPNPFNPATNIAFDVPKAGHVELSVYNLLGQKVETLVNEVKDAGSYTVAWNASSYSSGVYFYRIDAGNFSKTMKMALVK